MGTTRQIHVEIDAQALEQLERVARARGVSVAELMREAVLERHIQGSDAMKRLTASRLFLQLPDAPLPPWPELEQELEDRHGFDFP